MSSPENTTSAPKLDDVEKKADDLYYGPGESAPTNETPQDTTTAAEPSVAPDPAVPAVEGGANPAVVGDPESATFVDPSAAPIAAPSGNYTSARDIDGDGIVDSTMVDLDGDGVVDQINHDTNGDGKIDVIEYVGGAGKFNAIDRDTN
ncbi:hypothetical protein AB4Z09_25420 [Rhodococcus sp. TAF43]|uniref:hypothetical protein n=1 Tax=Rhodococcus sp. TAF43 TaxID=3237483 RepID=UPI003F9E4B82